MSLDLPVLGSDIGRDILIEEFENEWNTIGEDEVLWNKLKLVHVVNFGMFEKENNDSGNSLHNNFFMASDVNAQFDWLLYRHPVHSNSSSIDL